MFSSLKSRYTHPATRIGESSNGSDLDLWSQRCGFDSYLPSMESLHSKLDLEYNPKKGKFRSYRDELVSQITDGINSYRVGTKYKPITKRRVALLINKNPYFKGRDGEVELLLKECLSNGSFSKFFWVTNGKDTQINNDI